MKQIAEHLNVIARLTEQGGNIEAAAELIRLAFDSGGKLMLCGNGGSAADAQHLAAEFIGRLRRDRPPKAAIALTVDSSALTCIANDYDFASVFSRQVQALGKPGDVLVAISTSGKSENVIRAAQQARDIGVKVIGLTGDGGGLHEFCDVCIRVPCSDTARIQEAHILVGHILCEMTEATGDN